MAQDTRQPRHRNAFASRKAKQAPKVNEPEKTSVSSLYGLSPAMVNTAITVGLCATAFYVRAYQIELPNEVVFDEVHFGKFAAYYVTGRYFFDVHPPLAKMMIAAVAWLAGFDGKFEFDNIGDSYIENNVPYKPIRLFIAAVGSLHVPLVFQILRETGTSTTMALIAALAILFDNAQVLQSRLILLDAPLVLFVLCSLYSYVKFYTQRYRPFQPAWWAWLTATGVSLALTISCKMVGLLTFFTIGGAVLFDLWNLLDVRRGLSMRVFIKHFCARATCLIVVPFLIYLSFFYIHFSVLTQTGSGDDFMSLEFQQTLNGNEYLETPISIHAYDSITLRHVGTNAYLHSHPSRYPLEYEDGRISSEGQQVTAYEHQDDNNLWRIEPVEPVDNEDGSFNETRRMIHHNQLIRLLHLGTNTYLMTHDVASPLMMTNMEFTTVSGDNEQEYANTLFKVMVEGATTDDIAWDSRRTSVRLVHNDTGVVMWTRADGRLPDWGYGQLEVNGDKNQREKTAIWTAMDVRPDPESPLFESRSNIPQEPLAPIPRSFLQKYTELQGLMLSHNNQLTSSHPYDSRPQSWPVVYDGVAYWSKDETQEQIGFFGNVVSWWCASFAVLAFVAIFFTDLLCRRRGLYYLSTAERCRYLHTTGFFVYAWACHYVPFFLMHRQLFIHHYLPAHACSVLVFAGMLDFVTSRSIDLPITPTGPEPPAERRRPVMRRRQGRLAQGFAFVFVLSLVAMFQFLSPFTYGNVGLSEAEVRARQILPSWRLQFLKN